MPDFAAAMWRFGADAWIASTVLAIRRLFDPQFRRALISSARTFEMGLMSLAHAVMASGVMLRRVRRAAERTSCSISAPVQPSLAAAMLAAHVAGALYFARWTPAISARSLADGRSTKKRSSKRPARVSSAGNFE